MILTDEDLDQLPVATSHEIDVVEFVPASQVDPILFAKSYYLEPDAKAAKPYALLREALVETERMAIVKVALRQKETLAVLRVRDKAILLQTMLWPDEIRKPDFAILDADVELRPQELKMAASLVESMAADFEPEPVHRRLPRGGRRADRRQARARRVGRSCRPRRRRPAGGKTGEVIDLLTALQRSVDRARGVDSSTTPAAVRSRRGARRSRPRPPRRSGAGEEGGREDHRRRPAKKAPAEEGRPGQEGRDQERLSRSGEPSGQRVKAARRALLSSRPCSAASRSAVALSSSARSAKESSAGLTPTRVNSRSTTRRSSCQTSARMRRIQAVAWSQPSRGVPAP